MMVYLVQHAKPKPEEEDPQKPLSDQGRNDATKVSRFLKNIHVQKVFHSGKLRAEQTGEILAKSLNAQLIKGGGLEPMAEPQIWADKLNNYSEDLMIVGHQPHLGKLASLLVVNNSELQLVNFQQGGVVCLEKKQGWSVSWMIVPNLLLN